MPKGQAGARWTVAGTHGVGGGVFTARRPKRAVYKNELKIATDWLLRGPLNPAQAGRRRQECSGRAGLIPAGSGKRAFRCNARCSNFATALSETRESVTQIRRLFQSKTGWGVFPERGQSRRCTAAIAAGAGRAGPPPGTPQHRCNDVTGMQTCLTGG